MHRIVFKNSQLPANMNYILRVYSLSTFICLTENLIRGSTSTIQGVGANFQAAPASVDGRLDVCAAVVTGQAPAWVVSLGIDRNISNVIIYVNGT